MLRPFLLLAATFALSAGYASAQPLALTHVTIIDATGRAPITDGVVVVDRGRITAIGPAASTVVPRDATVVDKTGKYVIPGLINANVHLFSGINVEALLRFDGHYDEVAIEGAQVALKTGQTTVFDTWGPHPDLKSARDRINRHEVPGARVFFAGNIIGWDGPASPDFRELDGTLRKDTIKELNARWTQGTGRELLWDTADEVGRKVAAYAAKEEDFLKYASNGHFALSFLNFSQASQDAIVKAGHDAGKTVQAHVHSQEGIRSAIKAGVDILTHCDITPERTTPPSVIKEMLDAKVFCSILPTTLAYRKENGDPPVHANSMINIKNMVDAGVPLMLSTDGSTPSPPSTSDESKPTVDNLTSLDQGHLAGLRGLEEIGIDRMTILQIATRNVARGYKVDKDLGTLEVGKYADMVVLDADPLASAAAYAAIDTVIKEGEVVDRAKLPTRRWLTRPRPVDLD